MVKRNQGSWRVWGGAVLLSSASLGTPAACSPRVEVASNGEGSAGEGGNAGGATSHPRDSDAGQSNAQGGTQDGQIVGGQFAGGQAGTTSTDPGCDCTSALSWQATTEETIVNPPDVNQLNCADYRRVRPSAGNDELCRTTLACVGSTGATAVALAVARPDVQAALAVAPIFFGSDPRPTNEILQITVGGRLIEIGAGCGDLPACVPPPAGVVALANLLTQIQTHELSQPACAARCPEVPYSDHIGEPCTKFGADCSSDAWGCSIACKNGSWTSTDPVDCRDPNQSFGGHPDQ